MLLPTQSVMFFLYTLNLFSKIQPKPFRHPIESTPVDPKNFRGLDFIPLGFFQDAQQVALFNFLKRQIGFVIRFTA